MAKILLVEDDVQTAQFVADSLRAEKHVVDFVHSAVMAQEYLLTYTYDLVILDWQLPDGSGVDLCKEFKIRNCHTPVLMLTGKGTTQEIMTGLDSGADDYLVKPFSTIELAARVRALLRRLLKETKNIQFAGIELDLIAKKAIVSGNEIRLRPREFSLLECLINNAEQVVTHTTLRNQVWWDEVDIERNTINAMVARLRTKLQGTSASVSISSVPGVGFKLEEPSKKD